MEKTASLMVLLGEPVFFQEHDAQKEVITVAREDGKFRPANTLTLKEIKKTNKYHFL